MKILFLNANGGGFATPIEVESGTTVGQLFAEKLPDRKPEDFLIRVDRQPCANDEILREGCRVSVTPTKIEGA